MSHIVFQDSATKCSYEVWSMSEETPTNEAMDYKAGSNPGYRHCLRQLEAA